MTIHAHALLFDNDGTLVSSLASVERCWTRWAREYGITAEEFRRVALHGRPAAEIVADLLPARLVPEAVARVEQLEVEDVPDGGVQLLPGTREFLALLPADRWAVVTSATYKRQAQDADLCRRHHPWQARPRALPARRPAARGGPGPLCGLRGRPGRTPGGPCGRHDHRGVGHNPPVRGAGRRPGGRGPVGLVRTGHRRGSGNHRSRLRTVRRCPACGQRRPVSTVGLVY